MIYVRTVKYHVTIKGVVNLYFPVKKLPSVPCNNAVGDRAHGATLLSERNLCVRGCGRGFTRTRLRHWERLPFVLRPQRPAPCTSFIFRSKATLPLAPDDPAPSTPPSFPLLPPAPLALTAGYFPPGAQHRPENLTLVLCARDLSGACSRWCFLASLSLPPSSSGRVGLSSTTSKHTAACPVCRALRRPVAAHSSSVREVLYLPTFCG